MPYWWQRTTFLTALATTVVGTWLTHGALTWMMHRALIPIPYASEEP